MFDIVRHRRLHLLTPAVVSLMLTSCHHPGIAPDAVELTLEEQQLSAVLNNLLAGDLYGHQGDTAASGDYYTRAALLSTDPQISVRAIEVALWGRNYEQAAAVAQHWMELDPAAADPLRVLALTHVLRENLDAAIEAYVQSIERDTQPDGGFQAINAALSAGGLEQARLPVLRALASRFPDNPAAGYHYARAALDADALEEAREAIRRVVAQQPNWSLAVVQEFEILRATGQTDEAIARLRAGLEQPLQNPLRVRQLLADALLQDQRHLDARVQYEKLLQSDPQHPNWHFALGIIAVLEKNWHRAREHFTTLHQLERPLRPQQMDGLNHSVASYFLGLIAEHEGGTDAALAHYGAVDERDYVEIFGTEDYYQRAHLRSADLLLRTQDMDAARAHLEAARTRSYASRNVVMFYATEATLLQDAGDLEASHAVLSEGLTRFVGNAQLLYQRALLAGAMELYADLEQDLTDLLAREPDHPHALNALGYTWADLGRNLDQAREYIERAHAQLPEDAAILDSLGWVHYRLGNLEEAEHWLRAANIRRTGDGEILAHLIEVLLARGNHAGAQEMYRQAIEQLPSNRFLDRLAGHFSL